MNTSKARVLAKPNNLTKLGLLALGLLLSISVLAANKTKTYSEDEFLTKFSGKSNKVITAAIGKPYKKELSVKPADADSMITMTAARNSKEPQKPVKVEMWYYKNIVKYDTKNTYKVTELTFVNDRCMNIGFFNNK